MNDYGYGLWALVVINSAVFILFALSFAKPQSGRDWRSFGAFSAFLVALFVEMYGFPLTLFLLSGWLQTRYPSLDILSHDAGHLWPTLMGWEGNPHWNALSAMKASWIAVSEPSGVSSPSTVMTSRPRAS